MPKKTSKKSQKDFFKKDIALKLLILILIAGTFFRLYQLGTDNFWFDEALTVDVTKELNTTNEWLVNHALHPPLYLYFIHFWSYLGKSEFMLRLSSAIFSILTIIFIYKIAVLLFNKKVALLSALIVSLSSAHIRMAQEFRLTAMLILASAITVYFLLRALKENKRSSWIAYVISAIVCVNVDYMAGLLFLAIFLFVMIAYWKQKPVIKPFIISEAVIFLFCIPLFYYLFFIQISHLKMLLSPLHKYWALLIIPYNFYVFSIGRFAPFMDRFTLVKSYIIPITVSMLIFLLLFLKGLFSVIKEDKKKVLFLLLVLLLPLIISLIPNLLGAAVKMDPKRYLYISFPYHIILAVGISKLKKKLFYLAIIFIIAISLISISGYYSYEKPHWQEVANYVETASRENDGILVGWLKVSFKIYYKGDLPTYGLPFDKRPYSEKRNSPEWLNDTDIAKIFNEGIRNHPRLWFIQRRNPDPSQLVYNKYLDENYELVEKKYFVSNKNLDASINLSLYKKP